MTKYVVLIPLLVGALSASAYAQPSSVAVGYRDLDLTSDAGVARLDRRIRGAVEKVCGDPREEWHYSAVRVVLKCGRETWSDVASQRQSAIDRANGKQPSVEVVDARTPGALTMTIRRR